jgi:ribonuclease VapC
MRAARVIVDSSAIVAIAFQEPEASRMALAIAGAREKHISAVNWLETMMVVESRAGISASEGTRLILSELGVSVLPFSEAHMREAQDAWQRFGKGRHPAGLNMGDCCAYGVAKTEGRPLLFKGGDFEKTDIARVEW